MKDEKIPEIGPPMGETGSCSAYNYLGSSKLDPLTVYVRCWDPHWCMRKITTSLGKALRERFQKTRLWRSSHEQIFCSFKKTIEAIAGPECVDWGGGEEEEGGSGTRFRETGWDICTTDLYNHVMQPILKIALEASRSDELVSLGLYNYVVLVRYTLSVAESGIVKDRTDRSQKVLDRARKDGTIRAFMKKYTVAHALVARIYTATQYMTSTQSCIETGSKMGLWLQLWLDEMLDLSYHTFLGNLLVKDHCPPTPPHSSDEEDRGIKEEGGIKEEEFEPLIKEESEISETKRDTARDRLASKGIGDNLITVKEEPKTSSSGAEDDCMNFADLFGSVDSQDREHGADTERSNAIVKDWVSSFIAKKENPESTVPIEEGGKPTAIKKEYGAPDTGFQQQFIPDIHTARLKNDERTPDSECGVRCDKELYSSGAMFMLRPHGRRFVTIGEIFDVSELLIRGNIWREIRPTTKDFLAHMIHFLMSKPRLHKCLIRNIEDILQFYCEQNPLLSCLVKDLIHITMMGNYPRSKHRPGFLARMFLRRDNLAFFRADDETSMTWFAENRKLVYYTLKEFYLYLVSLSPAIEELLVETQWHSEHSAGIQKCMDHIRTALDRSYSGHYYSGIDSLACKKLIQTVDGKISFEIGTGLNLAENITLDGKVLEEIRVIIKRVHNSQLKYITKLRKGSFAQVLANEMRSWYSREDKEEAMQRFRAGQLAEEDGEHMFSGDDDIPIAMLRTLLSEREGEEDIDENDIDEDSDEDLGKQILDPALQVIERVWKDSMPLIYAEDTGGHDFSTRIPLTEVIEYMYGSESGDSGLEEDSCTADDEDSESLLGDEDDEDLQTLYKEELIRRLVEDAEDVGGDEETQRDKIVKKIEESGIIGKMVLVDPDDYLSQDERNAIYLVAQYAKTRYDGVFEFWWLYPLGMSAEGFYWLKEMYYRFEITDVADNRLRTNLEYLFCTRPRDFYLLLGFLREFLTREDPEYLWLGEQVALAQLEATRTKFSVLPWEPSNVDLLGTRYYCVCGEWGDMVVGPFSEKRDSYSVGLSGVYCDALTGRVHCKKDKDECFDDELRKAQMIGRAAKHGGRWYALCATCGMMTLWNDNQQSHRGPDCGKHRRNAEYAVDPEGHRAVIINGVAVTDQTRKKCPDPPGLDRLFMARKRAGTTRREITRQCLYCKTDGRGSQGVAVWVLRIPEEYDVSALVLKENMNFEQSVLYYRKTRKGEALQKMNPSSTSRKHHDSCLRGYNELGRFEFEEPRKQTGESVEPIVIEEEEEEEEEEDEEELPQIEARNVRYARPQMTRIWLCNQDWKNARTKLGYYPVPLMQDLIAWIARARRQKIRRSKTRRIIKQVIT